MVFAIFYGFDYASVRRRMNAQKQGDPFDAFLVTGLMNLGKDFAEGDSPAALEREHFRIAAAGAA